LSNRTARTATARLRRSGATKNFRGQLVTGHRTQLTIAITDSAITMKMRVQNITASEASRKKIGLDIGYLQLICDILGYISRK